MRKSLGKFSPLGWRLVAATVAFSTFVALLATFIQLYFDYRHDLGTIQSTLDQVDRSYLPTIGNDLWATNRKELQVALDGIVQLPDVQYVEVMENNNIWAQAGVPKTQNIQFRDYPLTHAHRGVTMAIGSLRVVMDLSGVYQRLLDKFWVILVTNGIKTSLVAGFMLWLFHSLVTRHLRRIADFSAQLSADNLNVRLTLERPAHAQDKLDEFDLVLDGLTRMQSNLSEAILTLELDIYKLEQAEEEIFQLNAALEKRVAERTAQLEAVNLELEAFSYSVSHDLRTPLRSIDGFSQALAEDYGDRLDEVGHDYLSRVRRAAQRMGLLIDDLLRLARITRAEMKQAPVDLSALSHEVIADLHKFRGYNISPFQVQEGMVVYADSSLLRIMMENLLDNAWKYSSKIAHPRIEVGSMVEEGNTIYFVRDNGIGFDMVFVGKLFGAFQRLHRADEFPGTGVGLATVKRIMHRHGGEIWAEGEPGKGAVFRFTFTT
jgi:signal transduction histidine kinase